MEKMLPPYGERIPDDEVSVVYEAGACPLIYELRIIQQEDTVVSGLTAEVLRVKRLTSPTSSKYRLLNNFHLLDSIL